MALREPERLVRRLAQNSVLPERLITGLNVNTMHHVTKVGEVHTRAIAQVLVLCLEPNVYNLIRIMLFSLRTWPRKEQ